MGLRNLYNPTEEHSMLRKSLRDFVKTEVEPQAQESDQTENFNLKLFQKLGELGLHGITVPEAYGGSGMDPIAAVIAHEELSYSDPGFCLAYLAHALLCTNNIAVNASENQKKKWLPKLCSGEWLGAMGMSEPSVGTDVLGMSTTAELQGDHYIINGRKMWITNGVKDTENNTCDILLLYAKSGNNGSSKAKISTFILEGGVEGFTVGQKISDKLGMRASPTAELCFDNCKIPKENLIGEEGMSLIHMMQNLEIERLGLAAMGVGIAKRALDIMVRYANERQAFGKKLSEFGQIQRHIADSFAEFKAARAYVYQTASELDLTTSGNRLDSDGVKLIASNAAKNCSDRAIQVLGGYGYVGEYVVERLWRDAKLLEIGGGTVEAHQKNICSDLSKMPDYIGSL